MKASAYILLLSALSIFSNGYTQSVENVPERPNKNLTAKKINGVYIPKDIHDCLNELDKRLTPTFQVEIAQWTEQKTVTYTKEGLCLTLRHDWKLWNGSRLSVYFNKFGITNANDMSEIIIRSYHRYVSGLPIRLDEQVDTHIARWEKLKGSKADE